MRLKNTLLYSSIFIAVSIALAVGVSDFFAELSVKNTIKDTLRPSSQEIVALLEGIKEYLAEYLHNADLAVEEYVALNTNLNGYVNFKTKDGKVYRLPNLIDQDRHTSIIFDPQTVAELKKFLKNTNFSILFYTGDRFIRAVSSIKGASGTYIDLNSKLGKILFRKRKGLYLVNINGKEYYAHYWPLVKDGKFLGLIEALKERDAETMHLDNLAEIRIGKRGFVFAIDDRNGKVIYHPKFPPGYDYGKTKVGQLILKKKHGFIEYKSLKTGEKKLAFFDDYPGFNVIVVASAFEKDFMSYVNKVIYIMTFFGVLILGIVIALNYYIIKQLSENLDYIDQALKKIKEGKLDVKVKAKGYEEFKEIAEALNYMINVLNSIVCETKKIAQSISNGILNIKVDESIFKGDLKELGEYLKEIVNTISKLSLEIENVAQKLAQGNLNVSINEDTFKGDLKQIKVQLENIVKNFKKVVEIIDKIATDLANAEFKTYDENLLPGDLKKIIRNVNEANKTIKETIDTLVEILENADINKQIPEDILKGELKRIAEAINKFTLSIKQTLKEIDRVITQLENGNLKVEVNDEIFPPSLKPLKDTLEEVKKAFINIKDSILYVARELAKGNLKVKLDESKLKGDLREIAIAFNKGIEALRASISKSISTLKEAVKLLEEKVDELTNTMKKIEDQTQATQQAAQEVEKVSKDIESLSQEILKINDLSTSSLKTINEAQKVVENIKKTLQERTKELASIVEVILQIAEQTNMLALNAAIEAARAGEQGRGFAVVADEVRKLAQKVVSATDQIKATITSLNNDIQEKVIENISKAFNEIKTSMESLEKIVESTVETAKKESNKINYVAQSIKELSQVALENLEELQEVVEAILRVAEKIKELEKELKRFQV